MREAESTNGGNKFRIVIEIGSSGVFAGVDNDWREFIEEEER